MLTGITVLADDLTGACEIAALGFRRGLRAAVLLASDEPPPDAGLLVIDTDSRLDSPRKAEAKVRAAAASLPDGRGPRVYQKVDSVLRGPVSVELAALARARGYGRVLLLPANPALGRLIQDGRYTIAGVPLHQTEFAADPHHPASSDAVLELLEPIGSWPVTSAAAGDHLPAEGVIVGDTAGPEDFAAWLNVLDGDTLPAGGAAFFDALLDHWHVGPVQTEPPKLPDGPALLISGTRSPGQRRWIESARQAGAEVFSPEDSSLDQAVTDRWAERITARLATSDAVIARIDTVEETIDPETVRNALATLASRVMETGVARHLIVEGGATAAAVAHRLRWTCLTVSADWGGGTVSTAPTVAPGMTLTLKPGSYPWPRLLSQSLFTPAKLAPFR